MRLIDCSLWDRAVKHSRNFLRRALNHLAASGVLKTAKTEELDYSSRVNAVSLMSDSKEKL
jgi:hypothetical protein